VTEPCLPTCAKFHSADCPNDKPAPVTDPCPDCGKQIGSFGCKAKHQHLNSGAFKAYIR